ncbi:hypothetical protein GW17_00061966 [Ensete ventricosum]|nr:hypothetical protein GW17_00061966 [Ensete ventricosum]
MHLLRFPNSGIRAKVFVRKIGFKLRVMRFNRVELLYMLVAAIGSESRRCLRGRGGHMHAVCMQRWLATARPPVGVAGHGLATCKGRPTAARPPARGSRWWPLVGMAASDQPARASRWCPTRKGLPLAASPAASRGGGAGRRGGRPLAGRLPTAKGSRHLRRGNDSGGVVRVKEG